MKRIARKSDGRRIYTDAFRREQIGRVLNGELTLAELSRKLGIARGVLQRWKRPAAGSAATPILRAVGVAVPKDVRTAAQQIGELHRLVGRQAFELDQLRAELDALRLKQRS